MVAKLKEASMCMLTNGKLIQGELFLKMWNDKIDVRLTPRAGAALLAHLVKNNINTFDALEELVNGLIDAHRKGTRKSNGPYIESQVELESIGNFAIRGASFKEVTTYSVEIEEDVATTCHNPALVTVEGFSGISGKYRFDKRVLGETEFDFVSETILPE